MAARGAAAAASGAGHPGPLLRPQLRRQPGSAIELGLEIVFLPAHVVVAVSGEIDMATAQDLRCLLGALADRGHTDVVLDLVGLDFIDSVGLQVIADTSARLRSADGGLKLRGPSERTRHVLEISAVSGLVELESSDPGALSLGSEQQSGDDSKMVGAAPADSALDLSRVAAMPAGQDVVDAALELITALAQATVGGADGVSVSLTRQGRLTTVAATDDTIAQMDHDQYSTGQGPCVSAAAEGHWFHVESLAEESRWPDFVPRARAGGIASILSTPLLVDADRPVGALNIYSHGERAFGPAEQELAALFATQASRVLAQSGADIATEEAAQRLQAALGVREVIAQAQGVVMAREGVSAVEAYATLRRHSTEADMPLRRHAREIVASTQGER